MYLSNEASQSTSTNLFYKLKKYCYLLLIIATLACTIELSSTSDLELVFNGLFYFKYNMLVLVPRGVNVYFCRYFFAII